MLSIPATSFERYSRCLAVASAITILYSVALSQLLLGLALAFLLLSHRPLRFPPIKAPLFAFLGWMMLSLIASPEPAAGLPQIRKLYVLTLPFVLFSLMERDREYRSILIGWAALGAAAAAAGLWQFYEKWTEAQQQGVSFYAFYVGERITGFMGHWMTFSGQAMIAFLLILALVLMGTHLHRWLRRWLFVSVALIGVGILLGLTRSVWLGTAAGVMYLIWHWQRRYLILVPILALLAFVLAPDAVRQRAYSFFCPNAQLDSNSHRLACWLTGLEMVRRHPLFGVGPERVGEVFEDYVPERFQNAIPPGWYGHLHSIYVHYAAERGLPALAALLWLFLRLYRDWEKARRQLRLQPQRAYLDGALAVLIAILVSGLFEHNLGDTEVLSMFFVTIAGTYAVIDHSGNPHGLVNKSNNSKLFP